MKWTRRHAAAVTLAVLLAGACGESAEPFGPMTLAGQYRAVVLTTHFDLQEGPSLPVVDQLEHGATVALRLRADSTATGSVFWPDRGTDGGDFSQVFTGTWTTNGAIVLVDAQGYTFLEEFGFAITDTRLVGDAVIGGETIHLELGKD